MILFIDFDGVLHPPIIYPGEENLHFQHLPLLESVLRQVPEVTLVLSTSWRLLHPLSWLRAIFSADIAARIIDTTPDPYDIDPAPELRWFYRQTECDAWLRQNRRRNEAWFALDDHADGFLPGCRQLIHCKPGMMLDEETAALLLCKLKTGIARER